ncbi:uncharacterized protein LOC117340561 [Pecten maximus]|uniref:uncharacterized protein LOC117340561 n=1 Tax=Pecten maximus TaxID=6579 RepID=UPI00145914BD|nr:uncharacterized protein LOC117340561 [Pecten maximus]
MNIIFILVGVFVTTSGILLKTHETALLHDALLKEVKAAATSSGLTGTDLSTFDMGGIIDSAAIGCISIGVAVCVIAMFGVHGIKSKNETILIAYASVIGILVVTEMVFLIVVYKLRMKVDESLKTPLRDLIHKKYAGFNGSDVVSVTYNYIMIKLSCCGVDGFSDFTRAKKWPKAIRLDGNISIPLLTPVACCKSEVMKRNNYACAANPTNLNSNYRQGCYNSFWEEVYKHNPLIISCATGVVLFELLLIFFACWVAHKTIIIRKKKLRRQIQNPEDVIDDVNIAGEEVRDRSVSVISTSRASITGSNLSVRRDSDGSVHVFPEAVNRISDSIHSLIEPPPYTSTSRLPHLAPTCMNFPMMQPVIAPYTSFPFGTCGVQSQGHNRCSCMFQGHLECICQRRRSSGCCNHDQIRFACCHHNDQRHNSSACPCEHNELSCLEQRQTHEKSLCSNDNLLPPYIGNYNVVCSSYNPGSSSGSGSDSITDKAKTGNEPCVSSRTDSNDLQKLPPELANDYRNNGVASNATSGEEQPTRTNQSTATDTKSTRTEDNSSHQEALISSQTCGVDNDGDAVTCLPRGMQRKRSLFNRRSLSGPCTKLKEDTPRSLFMRTQSFEEEYYS